MRFQDKVAIITGAAGGIGSATVALIVAEECKVAAVDISEPALGALLQRCHGLPGEVMPLALDAFSPDDAHRAVATVLERWGQADILVNCVGGSTVIPNTGRSIEELSLEEWKQLIDFNLDSMFLFCHEVLPHMKQQHSGKIVNLSSRAATGLGETPAAYAAAKAGTIAFTTRVANQVGPYGVNVNAVAPDTTLTERIANTFGLTRQTDSGKLT